MQYFSPAKSGRNFWPIAISDDILLGLTRIDIRLFEVASTYPNKYFGELGSSSPRFGEDFKIFDLKPAFGESLAISTIFFPGDGWWIRYESLFTDGWN